MRESSALLPAKDLTVDRPVPQFCKTIVEQVQHVMEQFVEDLMPQVFEGIVEQVRPIMSQERVSKHSKENVDVGTVLVPVLPVVEEDEITKAMQFIPQEPMRNRMERQIVDVFFSSLSGAGARVQSHGGTDR